MKAWQWAALVILPFGIGIAIGWNQKPEKIQTVERVVMKEDTQAREQVRDLTKQLETAKRHTVRKTVIKPDGTKTIDEDTHVDSTVNTSNDKDTKTDIHAVKTVEVVKETVIERSRPQWQITALAGVNYGNLTPVYGAGVSRRILGPFALGIWALSSGVAGVSLSLEF